MGKGPLPVSGRTLTVTGPPSSGKARWLCRSLSLSHRSRGPPVLSQEAIPASQAPQIPRRQGPPHRREQRAQSLTKKACSGDRATGVCALGLLGLCVAYRLPGG